MSTLGRQFIENRVGKKFRTMTDVIVENYQTTNDTVLTQSIFDELFENMYFETYVEFLRENVSLPVLPSQPQEQPKRFSFKTMLDDMRGAHKKWKDRLAQKAARMELGIKAGYKFFTQQGGNPKLAKEQTSIPGRGTIGLTLLPERQSGLINTCPCATGECARACLNMTGRGPMSQEARKKKLEKIVTKAHAAAIVLHGEIDAHERAMAKQDMIAVVRPNIVSDITWETVHPELFSEHPKVQFYDYTKIASRLMHPDGTPKQLPKNYHLTFSSTGLQGKEQNWGDARRHLDNGGVVAMVFAVHAGRGKKPGGVLPSHVVDQATGKRYRVVDGDAHDHRYLDKQLNGIPEHEGVIAGLRIKGGAPNLAKAGDFAVRPTDDQGSPVVVPHDHPANQRR